MIVDKDQEKKESRRANEDAVLEKLIAKWEKDWRKKLKKLSNERKREKNA